jgi:hypothetical protein
VSDAPADALTLSCAQSVRRAVSEDWHRPTVSWIIQPPGGDSLQVHPTQNYWPDLIARFDSAALLGVGCWRPFLQTTIENAADHCSTLEIGAARRGEIDLERACLNRPEQCICAQGAMSSSSLRAAPSGSLRFSPQCQPARSQRRARCRLDDIASLDPHAAMSGRTPASLLIVDPPWDNRSAQRAGAYACMTLRQISALCISDWCARCTAVFMQRDWSSRPIGSTYALPVPLARAALLIRFRLGPGGAAAVWVTNDPAVQSFARCDWLPKVHRAARTLLGVLPDASFIAQLNHFSSLQCGLSVVAQLCWYKVTSSGAPVCPLGSPHKKPFELALIAVRAAPGRTPCADVPLPTVHICCSPSCHSRKPPLEAILPALSSDLGLCGVWQPGAADGAAVPFSWVELFGRECRRGGLVIGNQAVALNRSDAWVAAAP